MTAPSDLCSKCRMPKTSQGPGTITQWLFICRCDAKELNLGETSLKLCTACSKPISEGRKGTFTQFIFRAELCSCNRPIPPQELLDSSTLPTPNEVTTEAEVKGLDLPEALFPTARYKPLQELGSGASGMVYLAKDLLLNKNVAVKTLHQLTDEELIAFQDEAKATSLLNHKNIVKIIDFGVIESGIPYMVLEYIPGISLFDQLEKDRTLPWQTTLDIFMEVADALEYAHGEGILHRDIKPSNIIIFTGDEGHTEVKLIDFGVAQVGHFADKEIEIQGRTLVGTPHYMSPDQAKGETYTSRSDVYSIGCVIFECLAGCPPFSAETPLELIRLHAEADIPPFNSLPQASKDIPIELENLIHSCLAKEAEDRPASMKEVLEKLARIKADRLNLGDLPKNPTRVRTPSKRVWIIPLLAVLSIAMLIAVIMPLQKNKKTKRNSTALHKPKKTEAEFLSDLGAFSKGIELSEDKKLLLHSYVEVGVSDFKDLDLSKVEIVQMNFCMFKDPEVMSILGSIPNLERLILPGCRGLSNQCFSTLATAYNARKGSHGKLRTLDINSTDVKPGAGAYIKNLPHLYFLVADHTRLDDEDMKELQNLQLVSLTIEGTKVSDKGLKYLSKIKSLRNLQIAENPAIRKKGIKEFQALSPQCKIRTWKDIRQEAPRLENETGAVDYQR